MEIICSPKLAKKFMCKTCSYGCRKESDFKKHISTKKHIKHEFGNKMENAEISEFATEYKCKECNKLYKTNSGLWKHIKICKTIEESVPTIENTVVDSSINEFKVLTDLVVELVKNNTELQKQNQDFQKQVLEICKNNNNTTINANTNTNSHNKTFNLQFFLNEECKDAMNMSEFINSIQLKLSDIENFGKVGYVEGMSNIIIKKLNDTDMYKRPVHCTDAKRETLYVKEENKWEKEGPENSKMLKAVYGMNKKNYVMLNVWKEAHPTCLDGQTKQCDDYMKIMSKVMDGDKENINKVIKKVAKQVLIDK